MGNWGDFTLQPNSSMVRRLVSFLDGLFFRERWIYVSFREWFHPLQMELFHLPAEGGTAPRWLRFGETTGRLRVMFPDVQVDVFEPFINSVPDGI